MNNVQEYSGTKKVHFSYYHVPRIKNETRKSLDIYLM